MLSKKIIFLLFFALVFRIILMLLSFQHLTHKDILRFRDWATIPYLYQMSDPYEGKHLTFGTSPLNLPPGTLYTVTAMYRVNLVIAKGILKITHTKPGELSWMNGDLINAFLRIPSIVSDIIIGCLIFLLVRKYNTEKNAMLASALFLFNPSIFYNSSFWGQMDAIHNALFFIALYLFFNKNKFLTIFFLFLSLYVKLTLITLIAPLLLCILWLEKNKIKYIFYIIVSILLLLVMTFPISSTPYIWFYQFFQKNSLGEMNNITSLATNFWWMIFKPRLVIGLPWTEFSFTQDNFIGSPPSTTLYFGQSLFTWAIIITGIILLPLLKIVFFLKEKLLQPIALLLFLSIISLLTYLFLPHMHERYLYPFIPLMATSIGLTNKYLWIFIAISILNFLNVYLVWHPFLHPSLPYSLMTDRNFQWSISLLTVILGLVLYYDIYRYLKNKIVEIKSLR